MFPTKTPSLMKRSNERSLGEALGDMIDDLGLRAGLDEQEVIAAWDAVVGPWWRATPSGSCCGAGGLR